MVELSEVMSRAVSGLLVAYGLFVGLSVPQQSGAADTLLVAAGSALLLSVGYLLYCEHRWGWYASVLLFGVGTVEALLRIPGSGMEAAGGAALGALALLVLYSDGERFGVGSAASGG